MSKSQYFQNLFYRAVRAAVYVYLMFACLWTICWLVGEIFQKMGVA